MTKPRRTQAERSEEMRARLSQAAYEIIAERGHSAFRTAMVAARVGVSQGALLHHFPTKDAVTLAAVNRALEKAQFATNERLARKADNLKAALTSMIEDFRGFFGSDSFWVALDITMDASKNKRVASAIRRIVANQRRPVYARWTERLVALGWPQWRAEAAVRMSGALVTGLAIRTLWSDDRGSEALIDQWMTYLLKAPDKH
jgi:AcrR family transcriptional regulator